MGRVSQLSQARPSLTVRWNELPVGIKVFMNIERLQAVKSQGSSPVVFADRTILTSSGILRPTSRADRQVGVLVPSRSANSRSRIICVVRFSRRRFCSTLYPSRKKSLVEPVFLADLVRQGHLLQQRFFRCATRLFQLQYESLERSCPLPCMVAPKSY